MYISEQEVRAVLTYQALIPAIREALVDYSAGNVEQPARMILRAGNAVGHRNGWIGLMPAVHRDVIGVKTVTFYPGNAELGLHTHMAIVELLNRATGEPLAVMDGRLITEMRTAAVSAVALAALKPPGATTLGILGSGVQARAHIQAFRHVWPEMSEIRVWSRTQANAERLAAETGARVVAIEEASAASVVLAVTSSPSPLLEGRHMSDRALVVAVGASGSSLREIDDEAMRSSTVIAESRSCVERESSDVKDSGAEVFAEIGEILAGRVTAPANGRVLFKSVGMAIEDLTAARLVWQAKRAETGPPERAD